MVVRVNPSNHETLERLSRARLACRDLIEVFGADAHARDHNVWGVHA